MKRKPVTEKKMKFLFDSDIRHQAHFFFGNHQKSFCWRGMAERYGPDADEEAATRTTTSGVHVVAVVPREATVVHHTPTEIVVLQLEERPSTTKLVLTCSWSEEGTSILEALRSATEVAVEKFLTLTGRIVILGRGTTWCRKVATKFATRSVL